MSDYRQNRFEWIHDAKPAGKWLNSPAFLFESDLRGVESLIPNFERIPYAVDESGVGANLRLDSIVRQPYLSDHFAIPVGVVSKDYSLVSHQDILSRIKVFVGRMGLETESLAADLKLTEYGERMQLSVYLPDSYSFRGNDGHPMRLRLECFNSVEGSTRLQAMVGWYRLVCSNGLVIGVTRSSMKRKHTSDLQVEDLDEVMREGIEDAAKDIRVFQKWQSRRVEMTAVLKWSDKHIKASFGFKAAARVCHIARTGRDGVISEGFAGREPSTIRMEFAETVPGTPTETSTLYDASQILAWLAKERRDIQEQVEWRRQIPELIEELAAQ